MGDSGIAALSRPGSRGGTPAGSPRRVLTGVDGRFMKSVLDATTKLIGSTGQRTRDLQKFLELLGGDNPVMKHFEMVGTSKMRAGGVFHRHMSLPNPLSSVLQCLNGAHQTVPAVFCLVPLQLP